ncbi:MAG: HEAT repeat domain-containing protein [Planctomycetia bacterium]|nr:HEAT repeat domain-containing protein [Planctomycetia bacterium]
MPKSPLTLRQRKTGKAGRLLVVLLCTIYVAAVGEHIAGSREPHPNYQQQIAATLVSWGMFADGIVLPVDQDEIDRHIAQLGADISEQRVRAAHWLASRGVRQAGPAIAAAMNDAGTARPCQLAHDLGFLGDDRWVGPLARAAKHRSNADLRVCATLALGELASPKAVDALISAYRRGMAGRLAIESLGKIADPSALSFLKSVARAPRNEFERQAASEAIGRIEIMQQRDPVATLLSRIKDSARRMSLDAWAARKLVGFQDKRAVPVLQEVYVEIGAGRRADHVLLAAALLANGECGIAALKNLAADNSGSAMHASAIAQAALRLKKENP